ncbi:MAG: glucose-6-phosphate dehydrogenase [Thermoplasmata archaeon]|nr:glucose-6-phosphate dehydrogenase [Thermoplasmata archaeon]MCI4359494.1 glucose-6-phosphate dehydrogenase [Thermoplasmata archaeon]
MGKPRVRPDLFVVLGATGDLMERKLLPALYAITTSTGPAAAALRILGCSRRPWTERQFRSYAVRSLVAAKAATRSDATAWAARHLAFHSFAAEPAEQFDGLRTQIEEEERTQRTSGNRVLYLALPAEAFPPTIRAIGSAGLNRGPGWTRFVIEKPFGRDLASARSLNQLIHRSFDEKEVYRIDHYLGKETVQNLLVFRFANMLFESVWNRDRVEHVEITVAEQLGLENRAAYYDQTGALRDMVQSHLAQLLTLAAMEVPTSLEADQVRNEKVKVLRSLEPIRPQDAIFGQYTAGSVDGEHVVGYRYEPGVRRRSSTETFVAVRLGVNSWRWHGIPFYLRTGKHLATKLTRIVVRFRQPPVWFFGPMEGGEIHANTLSITLQPDEGFELGFEIKRPGHAISLESHQLHFRYSEAFGPLSDGYPTLILDVLRGDQTLFVRADEVEESWRVFGPLLRNPPRIRPYPAGSWGPKAAEELLGTEGHEWCPP